MRFNSAFKGLNVSNGFKLLKFVLLLGDQRGENNYTKEWALTKKE